MILVHYGEIPDYGNDFQDIYDSGGCTNIKCKEKHLSIVPTQMKPRGIPTRPKRVEIT